ncbi:MAG: TolC family protein [Sandaracinaceae bacterium]|nr:TolC family protein [Sandaracinaceae bacterium]
MRALAAQRRFEAQLLALRMEVARAYWRLWEVRASRAVQGEQLALLAALSEGVRGRVEVGQATLADVAQIDLSRSRLEDADLRLVEEERAAEAALRAAIGAPAASATPTAEAAPEPALPAEDTAALAADAREHPYVRAFLALAEASGAEARAAEAERFPRLRLSVEAMIGHDRASGAQSPMEGVIAGVGLTVPLWQDAYAGAQRAAEADADAGRAEARAAEDAAVAELEQALSSVLGSHRRVRLYERTLLPQARSAYESVIGAYAAGRGSIAQTSLAQRDLLELALGLVRARAEHGVAWARLERAVGRAVERQVAHD